MTLNFPKSETYGLTSQIRRCAISIPSNIAEGFQRHHKKEYVQFLHIALASGAELETQLIIACDLNYLSLKDLELITFKLEEIQRMLQQAYLCYQMMKQKKKKTITKKTQKV